MPAGPPAIGQGSTSWWPVRVQTRRGRVMTFKHKLAHRLALLRDRTLAVAVAGLAFLWVASCEKPVSLTQPNASVAQLVVSAKVVTLQPDQMQDFTAVGFTTTGDTPLIGVTGRAAGGLIDTSSSAKRRYGI